MKKILLLLSFILTFPGQIVFSQNTGKKDVFTKANNAMNKAGTILAVFQPYLLKARQLFYDAKQLASDARQSGKAVFSNQNGNAAYNSTATYNNTQYPNGYDSSQYNNSNTQSGTTYNQNNADYSSNDSTYTNTASGNVTNSNGYTNTNDPYNQNVQNYLPAQSLPINNPATINNDGTGNWGNQNNGLYGNCLDVLTGTVMGLGEAEESPKSVDVIFIAANGSYQLWSPDYARDQVAAQYTSRSTYESVSKWSDANETEISETHITSGQFDKIQNNSQILNAVKNAQNYASSITEFGKLDGKVFAIKAELEDRTVYGLIEVVKHYGTEGSNGYLKIQIKAQGIDNNQTGQVNANAYLR